MSFTMYNRFCTKWMVITIFGENKLPRFNKGTITDPRETNTRHDKPMT